jgi:hypothetical protein
MLTAEQNREILARIDRLTGELRELRVLVAGEPDAGELTEDERREIDALAERRAVRMRARSVRP